MGTDRRDDIDGIADAAYTAMGVTDRQVAFGYERTVSTGCATVLGIEPGLGEDEAWYARRAYAIEPGEYDYNSLFDAALRHFSSTGWTIQEYGGPSRSRALTALKDDVGVIVTVPPLAVTVTAGPCGRDLTAVGDRFAPVPG